MPTHPMLQLIHRGVWQISRRKGQRTSQGPLPYTSTQCHQGHPLDPNQFNIIHREVQSQSRTIKEAMFIHVQDPPQLQHWQIPTATHLGPASTIIASFPTKTNMNTIQPYQQLPPYWYPPHLAHPTHPLIAVHPCRGTP